MVGEVEVREALKSVIDPEIGVDLVNLGMIYEIKVSEQGEVVVKMTLSTPYCPLAPDLMNQVQAAAKGVPGVTDAKVELTFDPPWSMDMATEEAKDKMGMW